MLHGREVLKKGLIKRIGIRDSVDIREDKWIPTLVSMKPLDRLPDAHGTNFLCQTVRHGTRSWYTTFIKMDVEEILEIKLGNRSMEVVTVWDFERNRVYSVRSVHRILKDEQM